MAVGIFCHFLIFAVAEYNRIYIIILCWNMWQTFIQYHLKNKFIRCNLVSSNTDKINSMLILGIIEILLYQLLPKIIEHKALLLLYSLYLVMSKRHNFELRVSKSFNFSKQNYFLNSECLHFFLLTIHFTFAKDEKKSRFEKLKFWEWIYKI